MIFGCFLCVHIHTMCAVSLMVYSYFKNKMPWGHLWFHMYRKFNSWSATSFWCICHCGIHVNVSRIKTLICCICTLYLFELCLNASMFTSVVNGNGFVLYDWDHHDLIPLIVLYIVCWLCNCLTFKNKANKFQLKIQINDLLLLFVQQQQKISHVLARETSRTRNKWSFLFVFLKKVFSGFLWYNR